ncbi:tripartite tricarboxylate transporter substrate binding protein [Ramlibacter sp. 2FC]|uniref:tripartite tricarboxylate transporter substrate binding protein n=1 Tax=Ramlibacter sp. 2FC TaxID=2502188 RepID=UPI0010F662B0|nr:tripartite tricarboxylate transporter substrate binding protein [Ramlibacter sp. 2FC]
MHHLPTSLPRRQLIQALGACALGAGGALRTALASAPSFPSGPISLMVPYPAGGPSDVIARIFNTPLGKTLGTPVLVDNLGGVSGALGAQKVLAAPASGRFLYQGSPNELILSPLANAAVKFDTEDFQLLQLISHAPMVVVARKGLPAGGMDELISLARWAQKQRPLAYGSVGIGSLYHVLSEHLGQVVGAGFTHVPYKGVAPLLQDMAGGNLDFAILPHFAAIDGLAAQDRVKVLGQIGASRAETLKHLPTVNEGRLLKGFHFGIWSGYLVKRGTPEPVMRTLQQALHAALGDPQVRASLAAQSQIAAAPMSLAEAASFYASETAGYRKLAKAVGIARQ